MAAAHEVERMSWRTRLLRLGAPGVLAVLVSALGFFLRLEHALTFDGPARGSDYEVYLDGVRWMLEHWRPFDFEPSLPEGARYQPPLWFALAAVLLKATQAERAIASLSLGGWVIRQVLLAKILKQAVPESPWSALAALSLNALLPLSVLIDGKVNPEGPHATLFMIAVYVLWRMERQAGRPEGVSTRSAMVFGLFAGLALLTKGTSAVLLLTAALVLTYRAARSIPEEGLGATWRRLLRPALLGVMVWCLVVGWWCGPNLKKYGHPFPHVWDLETPTHVPIMAEPVLYRRPLGWALPFELSYMSSPLMRSPTEPRQNFWAPLVAGTWADIYNRGFCRLQGGGSTARVWGGEEGFMSQGPAWSVSHRCIHVSVALVRAGVCLTLGTVLAVVHTARSHLRTGGRRGSLVLPTAAALLVFFLLVFGLVYPFDASAVLNPRYLLSAATPMAACFGMGLGHLRAAHPGRGALVHTLSFLVLGMAGALLVFERFGR